MKRVPVPTFILLFISPFLLFGQAAEETNKKSGETLVQNIHIIDVVSGQIDQHMDVFISDGVISSIVPHKESPAITEGTEVINATDNYLTPGLVDGHVHFFQSGGLYARPDALDLRAIKPYEEELKETWRNSTDFMARYLAAGITSVCDVGGPMRNYQVKEMADSLEKAPELFVTGPLISTYAPEALNGPDAPIIKVSSAEEARELVRKQLPFDPAFIKIWFIVFPGQSPKTSQAIVEATIQESHAHGIPVAVHATELETARLAVELGADILVHSVRDQEIDQAFVDLLLENEVSYLPTLIVGQNYSRVFKGDPLMSEIELMLANPFVLGSLFDLRHLPPSVVPSWLQRLSAMPDNSAREMAIMSSNLKKLYEAGVTIVSGTDAGNLGTQHASSFYTEWTAMEAAGLSHAQILKSSTYNAAVMLNREAESGQVKSGMNADLVIWDRSPLEEGYHPGSIVSVSRKGQFYTPDALISRSPEALAQRQLNAYNARNLEAFLDCYHEEVQIYRFPEVLLSEGKQAMAESYGPMFENTPSLHCELVSRTVIGDKVIDEESVDFGGAEKLHAIAIYEFQDGLIKRVTFIQ